MKKAVALVVMVLASATPAAAGAGADWILAIYTAGPEGASDVSIRGSWYVVSTGEGRPTIGERWGFEGRGYSDVDAHGSSGESVSALTPIGGTETYVTRTPVEGGVESLWGAGFDRLAPGATLAMTTFVTGYVFDGFTFQPPVTGTGSVAVEVRSGSGTQSVDLVDASGEGLSIQALGTAVGSSQVSRAASAGIVGGFVDDCIRCEYSYQSPGGSTHSAPSSMVCAGAVLTMCIGTASAGGFAGPSGAWRFGFQGVRDGIYHRDPVLAVYAPIGDAWSYFAVA